MCWTNRIFHVFMMYSTGKIHVYLTGIINISTWKPFHTTNARPNLDLERQKSFANSTQLYLCKLNGSIRLKRFTYPCRLRIWFGRSVLELSLILSEGCNYLYNTHAHFLSDLNQAWLQQKQLQAFADAIHQKGDVLNNCWGFIDWTVRSVCRPGENQRKIMVKNHGKLFYQYILCIFAYCLCMLTT